MKIEDWFEWPTRSSDPAVNAAIAVLLVMAAVMLFAVGIVVALPLVLVFGIGYGVYKYATRPTPTAQLHAQTERRAIAANFPSSEAFLEAHADRLLDALLPDPPCYQLYPTMLRISQSLYEAEKFGNPLPPIPPKGTIEDGRYRDMLLSLQKQAADAPRTLALFADTISRAYIDFVDSLPRMAKTDRDTFALTDEVQPFATFPLIDVLPRPGDVVENLIAPFFAEAAVELGLFSDLRRQFERNAREAFPGKQEPVLPSAYEGTAGEIVRTYLRNTLFEALFHVPVPFAFEDRLRVEHMHVVGGSGHGKTQLLQHLILSDLKKDEPPALIVIDSQGEMLRKIQQLRLFAPGEPLANRLVIVDPEDIEHPPALNMFDTANARIAGYSVAHREQIEAGIIELYNYVFGALAAELTQKQGTAFAYVTRLMLSIPGASIHTLRELMEDPASAVEQSVFAQHILKLDPTSQAFFQNQFFTKAFSQTRQQIARRLYGVLQVPAFDRMFSPKLNRLDLFEAIQTGRVVLVNTSKALLKSDASALFGRYVIALAMKAAFERIAVSERKPAYLIIDEAAEYFDENLERLLTQARKFSLGILFAHQHLDQLVPALRSAVAANTSIKLAGGVSDRDARALAADMRTTAEFITSMRKTQNATQFACSVRNLTETALRLEIPFGRLEAEPRMTVAQHAAVLEANRRQYAAAPHVKPAQPLSAKLPVEESTIEMSGPSSADDDWRS